MSELTYPKLKYQGVEIKPGQHHTENPGYIYRKVDNPAEEAALEGDWHDSPREAVEAFNAGRGARDKSELEQLRARIAELEAGGHPAAEEEAQPRHTEEWPVEHEKRRKR
jgi:hypothetical protein